MEELHDRFSIDELLKAYDELGPKPWLFFQVSQSMPVELDFDGEMKPGFIIINPDHTGLEADLLLVHPTWEEWLLQEVGDFLRPVTKEDWIRANHRKLQEWAKDGFIFSTSDPKRFSL